jgi:hypothetical protein
VGKELREAAKEAGITADRGEKLHTKKNKKIKIQTAATRKRSCGRQRKRLVLLRIGEKQKNPRRRRLRGLRLLARHSGVQNKSKNKNKNKNTKPSTPPPKRAQAARTALRCAK